MFKSTKRYGHEVGLSCAFRQWRAESHCKFVHGYAIAVKFIFASNELDVRNWVCDFGSLKSLKGFLEDMLDHKTLVATDDPEIEWFREAHKRGIIDMVEIPATGCERMAEFIYEYAEGWLKDNGYSPRVWLESVEVNEHGANSAIYESDGTLKAHWDAALDDTTAKVVDWIAEEQKRKELVARVMDENNPWKEA
jgi:6-pyruvoyltetrahydropterin/6-carboxytetrahydropterin synthase